ncbi:unnamed protein product [Brassica oleracea]|uniref:No apical meristem-associated C-terminal domain-containing protein n=2 Tax=Brassica oleracea TaxID=3712 RepID=A0A0D3B460_BRAOL|nr:unnamed protein product [Brassica oleracea]
MMQYFSQTPHVSSTPTGEENVLRADEFPEFSTQIALGSMTGVSKPIPDANADDSAQARRRSPKWTTDQNLLSKWSGAYDNARRMQQSGWSENDVLAKAHELYSSGKNEQFNLMSEWLAVRDQPRYGSQVGGNTGSTSSGSKRSRESDASDSNSVGSNSVGSSARPMGREATKKKGKKESKGATLKTVSEEWNEYKQTTKPQIWKIVISMLKNCYFSQQLNMNLYYTTFSLLANIPLKK